MADDLYGVLKDLRAALNAALPEWQRDLVRNVGTDQVRDIVNDFRNYSPTPRADPNARVLPVGAGRVIDGNDTPVASTGTGGWVEAPKVDNWRPPGVDLCDRIADHFAALDRAERIREVAQSAAVQRALSEPQEQELKPKAQEPKARGDKKA